MADPRSPVQSRPSIASLRNPLTSRPRARSLPPLSTMALALGAAGCDSPAPASHGPVADRLGPISLAASPDYPYLVTGQVFNPYTGLVTAAVVHFFVETTRGGDAPVDVGTDANGQFAIPAPESTITVYL